MNSFQELINLICGDSTEFTPQTLISLIVVMLIIDGLFYCVGSILRGGRR